MGYLKYFVFELGGLVLKLSLLSCTSSLAIELTDYFRKCRFKVGIPEKMNNRSFLQSFILLFPLSSPPRQGLCVPITPLTCLKISHFLHHDKINRCISDFIYLDLSAVLHRAGPLPFSWNVSFPGCRTPPYLCFLSFSTATPQASLLATQSLCRLPHFQVGGAQGLAMALCSIFTHSLEDLNLPHSFKNHICCWHSKLCLQSRCLPVSSRHTSLLISLFNMH